jgi:hypothetical protein
MDLTFLPTTDTEKQFRHGTSVCPGPKDGPEVQNDLDCSTDKWELCLLDALKIKGSGGAPHDESKQAGLITFLNCFEGHNNANIKMRTKCGTEAGLTAEVKAADACFKDAKRVEALWKARAPSQSSFPLIKINGKVWQGGGPFGGSFAGAVCQAYRKMGGKPPKSCPAPGLRAQVSASESEAESPALAVSLPVTA